VTFNLSSAVIFIPFVCNLNFFCPAQVFLYCFRLSKKSGKGHFSLSHYIIKIINNFVTQMLNIVRLSLFQRSEILFVPKEIAVGEMT